MFNSYISLPEGTVPYRSLSSISPVYLHMLWHQKCRQLCSIEMREVTFATRLCLDDPTECTFKGNHTMARLAWKSTSQMETLQNHWTTSGSQTWQWKIPCKRRFYMIGTSPINGPFSSKPCLVTGECRLQWVCSLHRVGSVKSLSEFSKSTNFWPGPNF